MRQSRRPSTFAGGSNGRRLALRVGDRVYSHHEPERAGVPNGTVLALTGPRSASVQWDGVTHPEECHAASLRLCL